MKVIAINGSPRSEGNTYHALKMVGDILEKNGVEFKILHIGAKLIHGCIGCGKCQVMKNGTCSITSDCVNESIAEMREADGIIIASPVYWSGIPGTMKSFIDRSFYVAGCSGSLFAHKVGAALVAVRRSGGSSTLDALYHYLTYSQMTVATSNYWNIIHGKTPGEVLQDSEGVQIMEVLAENMLWQLKMREATRDSVERPTLRQKAYMGFIR